MALKNCPECGKQIYDKVKACPHCGYPIKGAVICSECNTEYPILEKCCPNCGCPNKKRKNKIVIIISIILALVLCLLIFFVMRRNHIPEEKNLVKSETVFSTLTVDSQNDKNNIESLVNDFFEELQSGNLDNTQQYLVEEYDYVKNNPFGLSMKENIEKLLEHYEFSLMDLTVNDESNAAFVNIEVSHPNQTELLEAGIANFSFNDENCIENGFMNKLGGSDIENVVTSGSLNLAKVDGEWKIKVDDLFTSCIFYGLSEETSFEKMVENEKRQAEEDLYIKEMIDLVDYRIGMMEGYSGKVPGINNISIKNNGDKQIDSLTLGIDFLDESGNVLLSKEITILGIFDNPIFPGYSWKMEKDKFFEIENIPEDTDLNRVVVSINEAQLSDAEISIHRTPEEEYIDQYIEVTNYYVGMQTGYRGKEPGISDVSIKNNGDKNISELTLTVYFQDANGKNIAEDSFMFIGGYWGGDTLKANYSWKMESNRYYEFKNLADEVDISRNNVKVTEIKFE